MKSFNFLTNQEIAWAIQVKGKLMEIPAIVITHKMGWFNSDLKEAWRWIFPLTLVSAKLGKLPLSDPTWVEMKNLWWSHLTDVQETEEEKTLVWESIPQISSTSILCVVEPGMKLSAR